MAKTGGMTGAWRRRAGLAGFALLLGVGLGGGSAAAQSGIVGGGFSNDPKQPIAVEADALEIEDAKQSATFTGNVLVTQGAVRMRADRLTVFYTSRQSGDSSGIDRIRATGNVHLAAPDDQSASGDWADYKVEGRQIEMGDSVVLRQGENVIRGSKLQVDLNSGRARVVGGAPAEGGGTGRVRGLFHPD